MRYVLSLIAAVCLTHAGVLVPPGRVGMRPTPIVGEWERPARSVDGSEGTQTWIFNADGTGVALTSLYPDIASRFTYTLDTSKEPYELDMKYVNESETYYAIVEFVSPSIMRIAGLKGGPRPGSFGPYTMRWRKRGT